MKQRIFILLYSNTHSHNNYLQMTAFGGGRTRKKDVDPIALSTIEYVQSTEMTIPATAMLRFSDIPRIASLPNTQQTTTQIQVWREDTFNCAHKLIKRGVDMEQIAVLSMASDYVAGGGFLKGSNAQEETLCRRSNLHFSLTSRHTSFYPMKKDTLLYTPNVTVFREDKSQDYEFLKVKDHYRVNVISAAAIRHPKLKDDDIRYAQLEDQQLMEEKVRSVLRIAFHRNNKVVVLGAWGAGAFGHSPEASSKVFQDVLAETEFINVFEMIIFAIIDSKSSNNCAIFKAAFPNRSLSIDRNII
jgi:uncharacterized protein (TIGR02452 family)